MDISKLTRPLNWTGDWSYLSLKWTEELKNECDYYFNDPSYTWMSLEDFQRMFEK